MRLAPASRSNGSRSSPCAHYIRFTEEDNRRLHAAVKVRGVTVQAFARAAVLRAVGELLDEHERKQKAAEAPRAPTRRAEAVGLGIRDRLLDDERRREDRDDAEQPQAPTAAPASSVTVHVHTGSTASNPQVAALARDVTAKPRSERREALRIACETLAQGAASPEERLQLAAALDEEIKRLDAGPRGSVARIMDRVRGRIGR